MQEPGKMKMNNFKKRFKCATAVKGNPTIDSNAVKILNKWKSRRSKMSRITNYSKINAKANVLIE